MNRIIHPYPTADRLVHHFAEWLVSYVAEVLALQPRFTLCLSGGTTPKALHILLAQPAYSNRIDWSKLHVFWGDERFVPFADPRNNARMAFDTLLNTVSVPLSQIYAIPTEGISPAQSAETYCKLLHVYFDEQPQTFDLVLLGLGDDAHTLSLFPGDDAVHRTTDWATSLWLESQQMHRVTLTPPIVNAAAKVAFLVTGANKAIAIKNVWHEPKKTLLYPAQLIDNEHSVAWWITEDALPENHDYSL